MASGGGQMTLSIRPYSMRDRPACLTVFNSNVPQYFRAHEQAEFESFIDDSGAPFFVLESAAGTVGCGGYAIRDGGSLADLCWGMIARDQHGMGLGEYLLLARLAAIVESAEVTGVRLGTCQLTHGFFQRYGFELRSRKPDGIAPGLDDVEMFLAVTDEVRRRIRADWRDRQSRRLQSHARSGAAAP